MSDTCWVEDGRLCGGARIACWVLRGDAWLKISGEPRTLSSKQLALQSGCSKSNIVQILELLDDEVGFREVNK